MPHVPGLVSIHTRTHTPNIHTPSLTHTSGSANRYPSSGQATIKAPQFTQNGFPKLVISTATLSWPLITVIILKDDPVRAQITCVHLMTGVTRT